MQSDYREVVTCLERKLRKIDQCKAAHPVATVELAAAAEPAVVEPAAVEPTESPVVVPPAFDDKPD